MKFSTSLTLFTLLSFLLVSCGGGGSTSSDEGNQTPADPTNRIAQAPPNINRLKFDTSGTVSSSRVINGIATGNLNLSHEIEFVFGTSSYTAVGTVVQVNEDVNVTGFVNVVSLDEQGSYIYTNDGSTATIVLQPSDSNEPYELRLTYSESNIGTYVTSGLSSITSPSTGNINIRINKGESIGNFSSSVNVSNASTGN